MTKLATERNKLTVNSKQSLSRLSVYCLLLTIPLLYWFTLAQTPVLGDPTEYTFVAHVLGVAHPPGYAFMTLVSKLFQTLIPFGSIAWRTHLVALTAGTIGILCVFGIVKATARINNTPSSFILHPSSFLAALTVAVGANYWQHSIHANPHIITAAFIAFDLYVLTKWYGVRSRGQGVGSKEQGVGSREQGVAREQGDRKSQIVNRKSKIVNRKSKIVNRKSKIVNRWLYAFCLSAGLGVTHHPLTVFVLPACVVFVLIVQPRILLQWKTLLTGTLFVALGMLVWAYFPLRAAALEGTQFPSDMNTWEGFLNIILALRLRENLDNFNKFGIADQWDRLRIFVSLLRIQYVWPVNLLALVGAGWLAKSRQRRPLLLLYGLAFICIYAFVMNTEQDVMAYLLSPFLIVGVFAGFGMLAVLGILTPSLSLSGRGGQEGTLTPNPSPSGRGGQESFHVYDAPIADANRHSRVGGNPFFTYPPTKVQYKFILLAGLLILPLWNIFQNLPAISLRDYSEGSDYVAAVRAQFAGKGEGAALLNQWETMTPLWYARDVAGDWFDEGDVRPIWVSSTTPWQQLVFDNLPAGPVYLNRFERSIFDAGFRLRPRGDLWQVVEPGEASIPPELTQQNWQQGDVTLVGYHLPREIEAGEKAALILAMRVDEPTSDIYAPILQIGSQTFAFTTDSHLLTRDYVAGEVIVERYDFVMSACMRSHSVTLQLNNLTGESDVEPITLPSIVVNGDRDCETHNYLANWRERVALKSATVRQGFDVRRDVWGSDNPLRVKNGETVHIGLNWEVLQKPEDSYTIFVHLIDGGNRPIIDTLDNTPLGGASPSHLWIPKWLPGQSLYDPYQMDIADIPPGDYFIEVGLYEQFTKRRLMIYDENGNVNSDRIILGKLIVEP